jgi:hypothetical protein
MCCCFLFPFFLSNFFLLLLLLLLLVLLFPSLISQFPNEGEVVHLATEDDHVFILRTHYHDENDHMYSTHSKYNVDAENVTDGRDAPLLSGPGEVHIKPHEVAIVYVVFFFFDPCYLFFFLFFGTLLTKFLPLLQVHAGVGRIEKRCWQCRDL